MSKRNILISDAEELDDIGLLFGGVEDQSLHHDTARQLTSWMVCTNLHSLTFKLILASRRY